MNVTETTSEGLRRQLKVVVGADELKRRLSARLDELIQLEVVRPGVEAWLDEADALGLQLAVASSSSSACR